MKVAEILFFVRKELDSANINSSALDAKILVCKVLSTSHEQLLLRSNSTITPEQVTKIKAFTARRKNREPISHIIGKREFFGNDFFVNKHTLDPRPDSETLIEAVLDYFPDKKTNLKILELGSGTGCLILTLLKNLHRSVGIAIDISQEALEVAKTNANLLNLGKRMKFIRSNWFEKLKKENGGFDIIISNPPYIPTADIENLQDEVKKFEPRIALDGGKTGLECYFPIAKQAAGFLKDQNSILAVEIGQNQEIDIEKIFKSYGLNLISSKKDLAGIIRCLVFQKN